MNINRCRLGAAALALVLCVSISPVVNAAGRHRGDDPSFRDTIVKVILKIRGIFGGVAVNDDFPDPPRP
jgi:hypothetical protein